MLNFLKKNTLKGKVAVVTGGSMGIGRAIAILLAKKGCKVVICARTEKPLREAQKEIRRYTDVLAVTADVSQINDVKKLIKGTVKRFKKINILVNNAGVLFYEPFITSSLKEINNTIDINLKGVLYCSREALAYLERENESRIVNISSQLGKRGKANASLYSASKFGIIGFTESLALEINNTKAYTICPGMTDTRMLREVWGENYSPKGKIIPGKIARVVLSLCYPYCTTKNGSCIDIN